MSVFGLVPITRSGWIPQDCVKPSGDLVWTLRTKPWCVCFVGVFDWCVELLVAGDQISRALAIGCDIGAGYAGVARSSSFRVPWIRGIATYLWKAECFQEGNMPHRRGLGIKNSTLDQPRDRRYQPSTTPITTHYYLFLLLLIPLLIAYLA